MRIKGVSQLTWDLLTIGVVMVVAALYLGGTIRCKGLGFPLDDGWIHQAYARNLAQTGQFAYVPGRVSAGSTSPLWTLLLALGYVLHVPYALWAYVLGAASWLLVGWMSTALTLRLFPQQRSTARWVGVACLLEWHLAWAAFSGMETMLFTFLSLFLIERYAARSHPFWWGVIGGLLCLARPEGIVLVGLLGLVTVLDRRQSIRRSWLRWGKSLFFVLADMAAGLAVLIVPYIVFNEIVSGQPFPNTLYAKQAEYQVYLAQPIWVRLWAVLHKPLVGAQVLLIPGFVWQAIVGLRGQGSAARAGSVSPDRGEPPSVFLILLPTVWWGVFFVIYALRMPVNYQYGRYLMPTIPFFLIYGIVGTVRWLRPRSPRLAVRVFSRAMPLAIGCLFTAFLLVGGRKYADDVCIINGEMVEVARWLNAHTPSDALVAAHDIGAIGYFARRPLLDLAGLVTPEVIPFIRDETRLFDFIVEQKADYLVTFPSWYPEMVVDDRLTLVYQTACLVTRQKGGDNMAVYRIHR